MVCRLSRRVAQSWRDRHAAIKEDSAPQRQRIMPRGKKPEHELNAFQRAAAHLARPSYNRDAGGGPARCTSRIISHRKLLASRSLEALQAQEEARHVSSHRLRTENIRLSEGARRPA